MERETEKKDGERNKDEGKVPMYRLFKYADRTDLALMVVGTVAALASGASLPLITVTFGALIEAFGRANIDDVLSLVGKV
jgi:ATP-binding cassette, subfamily B (MDR/TAP), member 1